MVILILVKAHRDDAMFSQLYRQLARVNGILVDLHRSLSTLPLNLRRDILVRVVQFTQDHAKSFYLFTNRVGERY